MLWASPVSDCVEYSMFEILDQSFLFFIHIETLEALVFSSLRVAVFVFIILPLFFFALV
jgi:hypothetical protein